MAHKQKILWTVTKWGVCGLIIALTWACAPKRSGTGPVSDFDISNISIPGYIRLQEDISNQNTGPLQGRRIVLDPGHGGRFRGAIGPGNQHEADANLGVALYLRGLLEWAGATVFMTRTSDHDFLSPADSTLAGDLAFRVSFTDSLQPDVFISIHHNSTASADPSINETQTYYPLGADGASLDLARAIHRHLVINLNISPAKIMPGNFHVLRHASVPAVLGEPAMISNPVMAGRLSQAANLKLEAEAYFLGLLDYFASGTPYFSEPIVNQKGFFVSGDTIICPPETLPLTIQWNFKSNPAEPGPYPTSFQLMSSEQEVPFSVSPNGKSVIWHGTPPGEDILVLELRGHNLAGRSTPIRRTIIQPSSPSSNQLTVICESPSNESQLLSLLHWRGQESPVGFDFLPGQQFVQGTEGWALVPQTSLTVDSSLPEGLQWHLFKKENLDRENKISWKERLPLLSKDEPKQLQDYTSPALALPTIGAQANPIWIELPGFMPLIDPQPSRSDISRTVSATSRHWNLQPLVAQLQGRVIVLDAAGGGSTDQGQGPLGTRGSDLNLSTAQHLKDLLTGAGAQVILTRSAEADPGPEDKVKLANDVGAELYLTIARNLKDLDSISVQHHPQSRMGKSWAESIAKNLTLMLDTSGSLSVEQDWAYLLRHTACPAVTVNLPMPKTIDQENKYRTPAWTQAMARGLFLALVEQVESSTRKPASFDPGWVVKNLPETAIELADIGRILVDGNFPWFPMPGSIDSFISPGLPDITSCHTLELQSSDSWQVWLWESGTSPSSATLLLEGK